MENKTKTAWRYRSEENMEKHRAYQKEYHKTYARAPRHSQERPDKKQYYVEKVKPTLPYRYWAKKLLHIKI